MLLQVGNAPLEIAHFEDQLLLMFGEIRLRKARGSVHDALLMLTLSLFHPVYGQFPNQSSGAINLFPQVCQDLAFGLKLDGLEAQLLEFAALLGPENPPHRRRTAALELLKFVCDGVPFPSVC